MRPVPSPSASRPIWASQPPPAAPPPVGIPPTSPWHSPVPYLFGGLAAMLGLIALALLILACSYWKLNSYLGAGDDADSSSGPGATDGGGDGSKSPAVSAMASPAALTDLVAVVMAGEKTPRFLAAPIVRRAIVNDPPAVSAGEGEEEENSGKKGDGESGTVVGNASESADPQQTDHV